MTETTDPGTTLEELEEAYAEGTPGVTIEQVEKARAAAEKASFRNRLKARREQRAQEKAAAKDYETSLAKLVDDYRDYRDEDLTELRNLYAQAVSAITALDRGVADRKRQEHDLTLRAKQLGVYVDAGQIVDGQPHCRPLSGDYLARAVDEARTGRCKGDRYIGSGPEQWQHQLQTPTTDSKGA